MKTSLRIVVIVAACIAASGCRSGVQQADKGRDAAQSPAAQALERQVQQADYAYAATVEEARKEIAKRGQRLLAEREGQRQPGRGVLPLPSIAQITTEPYELAENGTVGEVLPAQEIRASGCSSCTWTSTTLPPGLSGGEVQGEETKFRIQGTPTAAWDGDITVYVKESSAASWQDSITWHLTIAEETPPDDGGDDEDPCATPLFLSLSDFAGHQKPYHLEQPFQVTLGSTKQQSLTYTVTGGKGPFTWQYQSFVESSYHCHLDLELGPNQEYSETYVIGASVGKENDCADRQGFAEWTENPTWRPQQGMPLLQIQETFEHPPSRPVPTWHTVVTQGRTLTLKGKIQYDGPLPLGITSTPVEQLLVKVRSSCPLVIHEFGEETTPPEEQNGLLAVKAKRTELPLRFAISYPANGGDFSAEIRYKNLTTYGDEPYAGFRLLRERLENLAGHEDLSFDFDISDYDDDADEEELEELRELEDSLEAAELELANATLAEGHIDLSDEEKCGNYPCEISFSGEWTDDGFGISDVRHVVVDLHLGMKADCTGWIPVPPFCSPTTKYGDMDVYEFEIENDYWKLRYDDEADDEGDDQMLRNNWLNNDYKYWYYISDIPDVRFKRKSFPDTFIDKWEDWLPPGQEPDCEPWESYKPECQDQGWGW